MELCLHSSKCLHSDNLLLAFINYVTITHEHSCSFQGFNDAHLLTEVHASDVMLSTKSESEQ